MSTAPILILGGTAEARELAIAAVATYGADNVITSLAGRTASPWLPPGQVRRGGFGGADGLARFIAERDVRCVIDATHPFARRMATNAHVACTTAACPHIRLERPPWHPGAGDDWRVFPDPDAVVAALAVRPPSRVFLALGSGGPTPFAPLTHHWFLVRVVDPSATPAPLSNHHLITARPPFEVAAEVELLVENRIDMMVCKASGGSAGAAKLAAARAAKVPVLLIDRPALPPGMTTVPSVAAALTWLMAQGLTSMSTGTATERT